MQPRALMALFHQAWRGREIGLGLWLAGVEAGALPLVWAWVAWLLCLGWLGLAGSMPVVF